ncbi:uncharacterized protein METZ01_LOCUS322017, partial [marine metagenome]
MPELLDPNTTSFFTLRSLGANQANKNPPAISPVAMPMSNCEACSV